ncbi:anthranilate phosphoribosyltransferase [Candidatus Omnitrophota bacterium]
MEKNMDLGVYIKQIEQNKDLSTGDAAQAMSLIMSVEAGESAKKDFLTALAGKGATTEEIASFALTIRQIAKQFDLSNIDTGKVIVDTCGTGGGGETFNISTTIMFILSAAGMVVAKHGNRAITSKCGSADVLEALGVNINMDTHRASRCLSEAGLTFLFAPLYHGAFKNVQKVRREIKIPTVFNIIGPLVNPAFANSHKQGIKTVQILGVNQRGLTNKMAEVLKTLNLCRAMVVYGQGIEGGAGMDEISTLGDTFVCELMQNKEIKKYKINPGDFGIKTAKPADLAAGTPKENAQILLDILTGKERGAKRDIVLLNAAAGLYIGGKAGDLKQGIRLAAEYIDSGSAVNKLELFRRLSCQA